MATLLTTSAGMAFLGAFPLEGNPVDSAQKISNSKGDQETTAEAADPRGNALSNTIL